MQEIYIQRRDRTKNMARFYAMSIQPNLFGEVSVVRSWGRIGTRGQMMVNSFANEDQAQALLQALMREKLRKGYAKVP
jgi:predicted DNA-binding WGR domain protein